MTLSGVYKAVSTYLIHIIKVFALAFVVWLLSEVLGSMGYLSKALVSAWS